MNKKLVMAFSGGADSTVLLYMAVAQGFNEIHTITFDYGQRHSRELECVPHHINMLQNVYTVTITNKVLDVRYIKDIAPVSSLTNLNIDNPNVKKMAGDAQPVSYVPFRNLMFLSICSAYAESVGADTVWYGAAEADSLAGYWDGSEEFINSVNTLISLNRKSKIKIEAPLIEMSKKAIIEEGIRLGVDFSKTWTCYSNRSDGLADADTPSSSLRLRGFVEAKYKDPIKYVQQERLDEVYKQKGCRDIPYVN
jgi:7-cyano-7-deazaguanine synthase